MAWSKRLIEDVAGDKLKNDLGDVRGEERFARYLVARKMVVEDILPKIKEVLPMHTDHDEDHVGRVMDNAARLIGLDNKTSEVSLSGADLHCLVLSILFHDVGNIFGREDHQHRVAEIYDYVFPGKGDMAERKILLAVTAAHCGEGADGSKDTLKDLKLGTYQLERHHQVKVCEIAAILRLADELEEGPERTSLFMQEYHKIPADNEIHHRYSRIIEPYIDRGHMRIALTYNINIDTGGKKQLSADTEGNLKELLRYIYQRISKLNQERKYNKYYCESLLPFTETTVAFDFMVDNMPSALELPPSVVLNDLIVPETDKEKEFTDYDASYKIENVIEAIRKKLIPQRYETG